MILLKHGQPVMPALSTPFSEVSYVLLPPVTGLLYMSFKQDYVSSWSINDNKLDQISCVDKLQ